ncbi:MAG: ABC transporter ATP-binding protein/permease [Methylococcaceae bacterium]
MLDSKGFFFQFIQLAGPFWRSENKVTIRRQTLFLFVLTVMQIAIAVVITEWSASLFNALEQHSMSGLFTQIGLIVLIFIANIAVTTAHFKIKRRLQLDWRSWLTDRMIGKWMNNGRHYQVTHIVGKHDNPDGRIAEDIRIATESAIDLSHSLIYALLLLVSFIKILWTLSGVVTFDLGEFAIPIHGHLVWLTLIYSAIAAVLGWWIGRPLTKATDVRQTEEANFRFGLVNARENSLAIALIHGETNEQHRLVALFQDIANAWQRQTDAWAHLFMFSSGYSVLSMAFPILVSAPRYILGSIPLGALMQSAQAFQQMSSALSWPVDNMAKIAEWRASVERVLGLVNALKELEQEISRPDPHRIVIDKPVQSILSFHDLCIRQLNDEVIVSGINAEIRLGERVLIIGDTATGGKLFKAISGLWPWGCGLIQLPNGEPMFFMPPRPYLPVGTLQAAICYPSSVETYAKAAIEATLKLAGLEGLLDQLEQTDTWDKALSRDQQQRLGLVRLLLYRPKWILLQEAFDSLSPEDEELMFKLICEELTDSAMLTITNQPTAFAFHDRQIVLYATATHS